MGVIVGSANLFLDQSIGIDEKNLFLDQSIGIDDIKLFLSIGIDETSTLKLKFSSSMKIVGVTGLGGLAP